MKLTRRLNVILLPVILLVFALAGTVVFLEYSKLKRGQLSNYWQQQLEFVTKEIALEQRAFNASLSEVLHSNQMIRYLTTADPEHQVFGFEESLHRIIERARKHTNGINQIQIIDNKGNLLISADTQDPFIDPAIIDLPDGYLEQINNSRQQLKHLSIGQDGELFYTLAYPFHIGLLIDETLNRQNNDYYIAVLEGRLNGLSALQSQLQQTFGQSYQLQFVTGIETVNESTFVPANVTRSGPLRNVIDGDGYQLQLTIDKEGLAAQRNYVLVRTALVASLLSLISFLVLRWLIQQQILRPINRLTKDVARSLISKEITLHRLDSDNEVASLNNAYLGLLNRVERMASSDPLTGLANRRSFEQWLERVLHRQQPNGNLMALLYIDLDNFKRVNDQYGHAIGDMLLQRFSHQLQHMVRPQDGLAYVQVDDSFARLAGDEFALLLTDLKSTDEAAVVAERLLTEFSRGIDVDGVKHNIQSSIGIVTCGNGSRNCQANTLLTNAEAAMHQAKRNGKNQIQFFCNDIADSLKKQRGIERLLLDALEHNRFELAYMPIYTCDSLRVSGVEVLLRCPTLTELGIGPDQFIPVAESRGLIREIDLRVIEHAFQQMATLQHGVLDLMAINISAMELNNSSFPSQVDELLKRYQINPSKIELELTETSIIADDEIALGILSQLKALGVSLSLDDFGTGYTAFSQLANCPVDCLKIDRSFVNNVEQTSRNKRPMLDMILSLGRLYELRVIAEGVETQEQLEYLQRQGCDHVQGFYLSKPLPLVDFIQLLDTQSLQKRA